MIRAWWSAISAWLAESGTVSLVVFPIHGDPINAMRRLRKGIRDVRDRAAQDDYRWSAVAAGGLLSSDVAMLLISHPGIPRAKVAEVLACRWPDVVLRDAGDVEPSSEMTVAVAAALGGLRRGVQPIRIILTEQKAVRVSPDEWDAPMPVAF